MSTTATVALIPDCDICPTEHRKPKPAVVDARTSMGPWANMCDYHWRKHSAYPSGDPNVEPKLGTGIGQRLILTT